MPLFVIEREFAERIEQSAEADAAITRINEEVGVRWLYSFLRADQKKTYCLYEAIDAEAIREAARRAGLPADVVVEVTEMSPSEGPATVT